MSLTIVVYGMTGARAYHVPPAGDKPGFAAVEIEDGGATGSTVTIWVKTIAQADALIKAGVAALDMLTQDGAPPPAECGPGACTCGRTVDHNGGVHEAGETP